MGENPPCTCFAWNEGECACEHDWTDYESLAKAWDEGWNACGDGDELAVNPYRNVYTNG